MGVLIGCVFFFVLAFGVHLLIWKIRLPRRQTMAILLIFSGTWVASALWTWFYPTFSLIGASIPHHFTSYLQMAFFHAAFTMAYVITYSAWEADSPTLVMIRAIEKAGVAGLEAKQLEDAMNDDILVKPRVQDLLRDHLIWCDKGKFRLTSKGRSFVWIFKSYRGILRASKGG